MDELERLREEIDGIDRELASAFERRMKVAGRIGLVKKRSGAAVLDEKREQTVLESRRGYIDDPALLPYWEEELKCLMKLSRDYQWTLNEDSPSLKK